MLTINENRSHGQLNHLLEKGNHFFHLVLEDPQKEKIKEILCTNVLLTYKSPKRYENQKVYRLNESKKNRFNRN